ncbi:hypothetical protein ANO14919_082760 [Xylariales sp. No.14919]|nr:hypothetical protein ANO14919_082760 [Xylariales sp. No.14919]
MSATGRFDFLNACMEGSVSPRKAWLTRHKQTWRYIRDKASRATQTHALTSFHYSFVLRLSWCAICVRPTTNKD